MVVFQAVVLHLPFACGACLYVDHRASYLGGKRDGMVSPLAFGE